MVLCKAMYGKDKENGINRMCTHFSQHFAPGETNPSEVYKIAERMAQWKLLEGFQVIYAVHIDKEFIHTHFVINSVNLMDGHKWQMSPKQLQQLKDYSDELCREYGLSVVEHKENCHQKNTYKSQCEVRMEQQGTSWKYETYLTVKACMEVSKSREEFIKEMNEMGYQVDWRDERKYITFTNPDGYKIRNKKLYPQDQFTKEALERRFELNRQYQEQYEQSGSFMDTTYNLLRLANSLRKQTGTQYPMQDLENNNSSKTARKERVKERKKGSGMDWER